MINVRILAHKGIFRLLGSGYPDNPSAAVDLRTPPGRKAAHRFAVFKGKGNPKAQIYDSLRFCSCNLLLYTLYFR